MANVFYNKIKKKMKNKKLNIVLIIVVILASLFLLFGKDKLNCFITNYKLRNSDITVNQSDSLVYMRQFTNTNNSKPFKISFVELGGYGCKACMRMDTVLAKIKTIYNDKINIQVVRVTDKENRKIAKYFGVNAIPTQIIIDKTGKEHFRHTGFLSVEELVEIINRIM